MRPYFSIIIPTLNEKKYLPKLLSDLSKQSHSDFEVVVVDGKSEDNTGKEAHKFSKKLPSLNVITSNTRNVSYQRNLGATIAGGKYLIFMDADNRIPPYFVLGLRYKTELTKAQIFSCWFSTENTNGTNSLFSFIVNNYVELQKNTTAPFAVESLMGFRKDIFQSLKGFDTQIPTHEGAEILGRASKKKYQFKVFKDPSYDYSFRRIKKQGKLKTVSAFVQLEASRLFGIKLDQQYWRSLYPMLGGKYFDLNRKKKIFSKDKLLRIVEKILNGEI